MDTMDKTIRELYKEYYANIRTIAMEIAEEYSLKCEDDFVSSDRAQTRLEELVDGDSWVFMTYKARLVAVLSENVDAYEDEMGEKPDSPETLAYFAMRADIDRLLYNEWFWKEINEEKEKVA